MTYLREIVSLTTAACLIASPVANSVEIFQDRKMKPGWHGNYGLGFVKISLEGSSVALQGSDSKISSLNDSTSLELSTPIPLLAVSYAFENGRTEVFFGNSNSFSNEGAGALGVRHELDDKTLLSISVDASSYGNEVLQDPFLINVNRKYIDADSQTLNLGVDSIFGSAVSIAYSYGEVDIKDDLSGKSFSSQLNAAELKSLQRSNTNHKFDVSYFFPVSNKLILLPSISYKKLDAEGKAESYSEIGFTSTFVYFLKRFQFYASIGMAEAEYEEKNPIFDSKRTDKNRTLALGLEYSEPFGISDTHLNFDIANVKTNSNIHFYDSKLEFVSLSMTYNFE